jgi:hypothetical protein
LGLCGEKRAVTAILFSPSRSLSPPSPLTPPPPDVLLASKQARTKQAAQSTQLNIIDEMTMFFCLKYSLIAMRPFMGIYQRRIPLVNYCFRFFLVILVCSLFTRTAGPPPPFPNQLLLSKYPPHHPHHTRPLPTIAHVIAHPIHLPSKHTLYNNPPSVR